MKKAFFLLLLALFASCSYQKNNNSSEKIITVSISPYKYFVDAISGGDFIVNVMVPPGSDPHIYEPVPGQITKLRASVGYIANGFLGFEMTWLDRFYETNPDMKKLNLGESIEPIESEHHHEGDHVEGADPHYWVSPKCALAMAASVRTFLNELNPSQSEKYEENYLRLTARIGELDSRCREYFSGYNGKAFMIYHPNLAYLARDYGLKEIAVESEGKEPSPSMMKELIDISRRDSIKTIFVQREYDTRNARAIAGETGARLVIIDPLAEDWYSSTLAIIDALHESLK
ncbi:MAG TPA: zinc ABC transporter substrate-binding protein [Bacteroidales bacterium]|nr:zinc ABC transporter substrate-binding protein [Bacteroidales bacterium]